MSRWLITVLDSMDIRSDCRGVKSCIVCSGDDTEACRIHRSPACSQRVPHSHTRVLNPAPAGELPGCQPQSRTLQAGPPQPTKFLTPSVQNRPPQPTSFLGLAALCTGDVIPGAATAPRARHGVSQLLLGLGGAFLRVNSLCCTSRYLSCPKSCSSDHGRLTYRSAATRPTHK